MEKQRAGAPNLVQILFQTMVGFYVEAPGFLDSDRMDEVQVLGERKDHEEIKGKGKE